MSERNPNIGWQTQNVMSDRARDLVDRLGTGRLVQALRWGNIQLRRASSSDCKLWELANDPNLQDGFNTMAKRA